MEYQGDVLAFALFEPLSALSAAYAETGQFERAIANQEEALRIALHSNKEGWVKRLELYRAGKPYRLPRPAEKKSEP